MQVLKMNGRTLAQEEVLSSNADVRCDSGIDDSVLKKLLASEDPDLWLTVIVLTGLSILFPWLNGLRQHQGTHFLETRSPLYFSDSY